MNISQKQMGKLISYVATYSRYKELYSMELLKDKPDWTIVEDRLNTAYSYATFIISIIEGTGIDPEKVADNITHFIKLYEKEMEQTKVA
jgi:hypothetical protein